MFRHTFRILGIIVLSFACSASERVNAQQISRETDAESTVKLVASASAGDCFHVTQKYEVGGHLLVHQGKKQRSVPMSVVAELAFDERILPKLERPLSNGGKNTTDELSKKTEDSTKTEQVSRRMRKYSKGKVTTKIGKSGYQRTLGQEQRMIYAEASNSKVTQLSIGKPLSRDALEIIALPVDPTMLDQLLPEKEIAIGGHWKHSSETIQLLIGLEAIATCEVESYLVGIENGYAKIKLEGMVQGAVDGTATEIELKASYLYDIARSKITRMNYAQKEKRGEGPIGPGVDVVAKLHLALDAIKTPESLNDLAIESAHLPETADDVQAKLPLRYTHVASGVEFMLPRAWHITKEGRKRIVMRHMANGDLTAQCHVSILNPLKKGEYIPLEKYKQEVETALGDQVTNIVSAREFQTKTDATCLRVIAEGSIKDIPIEWRYFLIVGKNGGRVAVTLTVEKSLVGKLGNAERTMIESLDFGPKSIIRAAKNNQNRSNAKIQK